MSLISTGSISLDSTFKEMIRLRIKHFLKILFIFSDKPLMVVAKTLYDYVMEEGAQQKNRLYM